MELNPDEAGSSPRVRGTRHGCEPVVQVGGIIPACAGNTCNNLMPVPQSRDHPRVCGEHKNGIPFRTQVQGSSPRVRGTRMRTAEWSCNIGIIPACAGNTMSLKNVSLRFWDHPRVCGEHHYNTICIAGHSGSSPRVRGTHGRSQLPSAV